VTCSQFKKRYIVQNTEDANLDGFLK
jgi:hypothetical protein